MLWNTAFLTVHLYQLLREPLVISVKLTKTQLRSTLDECTLDQILRLCIEGPPTLSDEDIDLVFRNWKQQKPRQSFILA